MADIKIFIAVHGRHDVLKIFNTYAPFPVIAVASNPEDIELCKSFGWYVTQHPNDNLADKLHNGLQFARTIPHDALLMLGSDDLISPELTNAYKAAIKTHDFVAVKQCYLYHMVSKKLVFWNGYRNERKGEPTGAGRLFRKDLLQKVDYNIWLGGSHHGVDGTSWKTIKDIAKIKLLDLSTTRVLVDLKDANSTTVIQKFARYKNLNNNIVRNIFPLLRSKPE